MHEEKCFVYAAFFDSDFLVFSWTENAHSVFGLSGTVSLETFVHAADSFLKKEIPAGHQRKPEWKTTDLKMLSPP